MCQNVEEKFMENKTDANIKLNKKSNKYLILIGLLISYFPSYRGSIFNFLNIQAGPQGPQSSILWNWLAVAVLILFIYFIENKKLSSILIKKPTSDAINWAWYFFGIAMVWY